MAAQKFEKGSEEHQMFTDYWILCQKYWIPEPTEEYWERFQQEVKEFLGKYKFSFARNLYQSLYLEIDRKRELMKKENKW